MSEMEPPAVPPVWWSPAEQMMFVQYLDTIHDGEGYAVAELPADAVRMVPETAREIEAAARAVVQAYEDGYGTSTEIKELRRVLADP